MKKVTVHIPENKAHSYPIFMGADLIKNITAFVSNNANSSVVIVTDKTVKKHYGSVILNSLKTIGIKSLLLAFPAGEHSKNAETKQFLEEKMLQAGCDRNSLVIALGGGVVGDLAGFVAATYMRGISYLQIPTTLLAMVDSSVGGKTAINTPYGKNMIGVFWQPKAVIADVTFLKTLPIKHVINGLVESIKMFLTSDLNGLRYLNRHLDKIINTDEAILKNVIQLSIKIKSHIVTQDEKEITGQRMILNFGHTIGHALERLTNYTMLHGFAVAYGLLVEAKIAELLGMLDHRSYLQIKSILNRLQFYGRDLKQFDIKQIIKATQLDKKAKSKQVHYIILKSLGEVYINKNQYSHPVSDQIVKKAFLEIIEE